MRCAHCGTNDSRVVDSRTVEDGIRRRRECLVCGSRFTTYERVERSPLLIVKRDGRREPFSREKLLAGLRRACEKRPLTAGAVEALAAEVERAIHTRAAAELPSTAIGEAVMERLKALDQIAYVRFASVYRCFADLDGIREILEELEDVRRQAAPENQLVLIGGDSGGHTESIQPLPLPRPRWRTRKPRDQVDATREASVTPTIHNVELGTPNPELGTGAPR
ncbi:MAG: transcriptional regulator NrdR [Dehalococcoidia bacterium]